MVQHWRKRWRKASGNRESCQKTKFHEKSTLICLSVFKIINHHLTILWHRATSPICVFPEAHCTLILTFFIKFTSRDIVRNHFRYDWMPQMRMNQNLIHTILYQYNTPLLFSTAPFTYLSFLYYHLGFCWGKFLWLSFWGLEGSFKREREYINSRIKCR